MVGNMERRYKLGFMNIIKWLVAGIIVMGAVWSGLYGLCILLSLPALIEVITIVVILDREDDLGMKEGGETR